MGSFVKEFAAGVRTLFRGFGYWRERPGLMTLALLPALIAFALLGAALVPLALSLDSVAALITPFAEEWLLGWRTALRIAVGAVIFIATLVVAVALFTALTLLIGDPFYQRIWRAVEADLGKPPTAEGSFWTTVSEGIRLIITAVLVAVLVLVVGLVPVIGGPVAAVLGVVLSGRVLARELMARAFDARDLDGVARTGLFAARRARVLGFGVATQLCFLIPLGPIFVMPAAVAGATMLARTLLDEATPRVAPADGAPSYGSKGVANA